jgi:Fis family transcriptional regulator, factor for inversion stimulation protein
MTRAAEGEGLEPASLGRSANQSSDRPDPLRVCVEDALETYLRNMDGHRVSNLYRLVINEVERALFETVLRHAQGNLTQAAAMLGLTRSTLRKRLTEYGIDRGR